MTFWVAGAVVGSAVGNQRKTRAARVIYESNCRAASRSNWRSSTIGNGHAFKRRADAESTGTLRRLVDTLNGELIDVEPDKVILHARDSKARGCAKVRREPKSIWRAPVVCRGKGRRQGQIAAGISDIGVVRTSLSHSSRDQQVWIRKVPARGHHAHIRVLAHLRCGLEPRSLDVSGESIHPHHA